MNKKPGLLIPGSQFSDSGGRFRRGHLDRSSATRRHPSAARINSVGDSDICYDEVLYGQ
jgi:hypothetical protein